MRIKITRLAWLLGILLLCACNEDHFLNELERIKKTGDDNPAMALKMLDSLQVESRNRSEYAKNKYELLHIRLNDKAYKTPNSDIMIRSLMDYFVKKGSIQEKQEVFYYAGSVYRDLRDTPRALDHFLKSLEYANSDDHCDQVMIRNTYSNLSDIYNKVQDYKDALKTAEKELEMCKRIPTSAIIANLHVGITQLTLKNNSQACEAFDNVFDEIIQSKDIAEQQNNLLLLLCYYARLNEMEKAKVCRTLINIDPLKDQPGFPCIAFAQYYLSSGKTDSAIVYSKHVIENGSDLYTSYDAARFLYQIYRHSGDAANMFRYADLYMHLSDSLDFGKRQEMAATANNEFQYHLDQKKEQQLKDEKEHYKNTLIVMSLAALLLACISYSCYIIRRNKHLQLIVKLSSELQRATDYEIQLRKDIEQKEQELDMSRRALNNSSDELNDVKHELNRVNSELLEYDEQLKIKEQQLAEKIDQNRRFISLLHQSELEGKAEDVINAVRQSSTGKRSMQSTDWKQLYQAVDELYPNFKDRLMKELGAFTEQQMQVCYLMRIGLSKPLIQNMTNLSRVTIWRWTKKYEWVLTPDE